MTEEHKATGLEELRAQLDEIDERMLRLVRERIQMIVRIAEHKREHGIPMMQPQRVESKHERAATFAAANGLDPSYLRRLYDLIIEESCRVEDEVIGARGDHHGDASRRDSGARA
ncbi:chorismate mutase family protein [Rubrobacter tropicus]|uniref:Chorismate mutase family protein n=1 Tax=Rubrobacter tropicus TaxID=2653851 RepID=A0A6G8QEJ1_9ACTN|nr:chorismate mutase family protein [Rubrobacter tropicus]QIN84657.1 chorismate mutase family protein [Rubrobacter tropicus]